MNAQAEKPELGTRTPEFAAELLTDLYIRLRRDLQRWAMVTHQTPQPRMGYVGQHLVSVVTGYPGGRSGARGDDLKLPNGRVGEIKCCYRVDQLGVCEKCGTQVASVEKACPGESCDSTSIIRKDDSKWLLSPSSEQELRELFVPEFYYLVLFEFADLATAEDIVVSIFQVDPRSNGFALCMIDYYFNIRLNSRSRAPFNLWPNSPKLLMMRPLLIYQSVIQSDDSVTTSLFPGRDEPVLCELADLESYGGSTTFDVGAIDAFAKMRGVDVSVGASKGASVKRNKLAALQRQRVQQDWSGSELADDLAKCVFAPKLKEHRKWTKEFVPGL